MVPGSTLRFYLATFNLDSVELTAPVVLLQLLLYFQGFKTVKTALTNSTASVEGKQPKPGGSHPRTNGRLGENPSNATKHCLRGALTCTGVIVRAYAGVNGVNFRKRQEACDAEAAAAAAAASASQLFSRR